MTVPNPPAATTVERFADRLRAQRDLADQHTVFVGITEALTADTDERRALANLRALVEALHQIDRERDERLADAIAEADRVLNDPAATAVLADPVGLGYSRPADDETAVIPVPRGVEGHQPTVHFAAARCRRPGRSSEDWSAVTCEACLAERPGGCSCEDEPDPNCRTHASRFRRFCGDPRPHGEHRWVSPAVVGSASWVCGGTR